MNLAELPIALRDPQYLPRGKSTYDLRYLLDNGAIDQHLVDWENPHIATLDFPALCDIKGLSWMDYSPASRSVSRFHEGISYRLQYPSETRQGNTIKFLPVVEWGSEGKNTAQPGVQRYRCLIECPDAEMLPSLPHIIDSAWDDEILDWDQTQVTACDPGWIEKLMPPSAAPDLIYSIDWDAIKLR